MQRTRTTRRTFFALCTATPALAADFWDMKPFTGWSEKETRRLLTDSPWARTKNLTLRVDHIVERPVTYKDIQEPMGSAQGGSPVGGIGAPSPKVRESAVLVFRWASAKPLRQARMIRKLGPDEADSEQARQMLADDKFYTLEITGIPSMVAFKGAQLLQDELNRSAALLTTTGRTLRPEATYVRVTGATLTITVRFPREKPITLGDKQVDFIGHGGPIKFNQRFKLKQMVYEGELEL